VFNNIFQLTTAVTPSPLIVKDRVGVHNKVLGIDEEMERNKLVMHIKLQQMYIYFSSVM
jgi:hypothetical protein